MSTAPFLTVAVMLFVGIFPSPIPQEGEEGTILVGKHNESGDKQAAVAIVISLTDLIFVAFLNLPRKEREQF